MPVGLRDQYVEECTSVGSACLEEVLAMEKF